MSVSGGPDIVENGLVLCLDAGNTKSYPGSGTVWTDLSRNGNNGTLINGPTFSSIDGGSILFDGTNDYVDLGTSYLIATSSAFTVNLWLNPNFRSPVGTQADFHRFVTLRASGTSTFGIACVNQLNSGYEGLYVTNNNGWVRAKTSYYPPSNNWGFLTLTYNGFGSTNISNFNMYWNTSLLTFNTSGVATPAVTTDNNYLGVRQNGDIQIYRGYMSSFRIYNRALSPNEILQNYNATKGRFRL